LSITTGNHRSLLWWRVFIVFSREAGCSPCPLDHRGANLAMGLDGVGGDDPALERQDRQHLHRRLQLVGLGIDPQLGHDGHDVGGVSGQKVERGRLAVGATAEGFAIDGKVRRVARTRCPVAASIEADSVTVPVTVFDELFSKRKVPFVNLRITCFVFEP